LLDLRPRSVFGDIATVDLTWGGDTLIDGHAQIEGAPSGLLATFLDLQDGQAVSARLEASGALLGWQLDAEMQVGEQTALTLSTDAEMPTYRVDGALELGAFGRLRNLQARFGDTLAFQGEVSLDQTFSALLQTDSGTLDATGRLVSFGERVELSDVQLRGDGIDLERLTGTTGIDLKRLDADGDLEWTDGTLVLEGRIQIPTAQYDAYRLNNLESEGRHAVNAMSAAITSELSIEAYAGLPAMVESLFPGRLQGRLDGRYTFASGQLDIGEAVLIRGDNVVSASGTGSRDGALDAFGALALSDIFSLQSLRGTWRLDGGSLQQLAAEFDGVATLPDQESNLNRLFGRRAELRLRARQDGDRIDIQSARVSSDILSVSTEGVMRGTDMALSGDVSAELISLETAALEGMSGTFDLIGSFDAPALRLSANADRLTGGSEVFEQPELTAYARLLGPPRATIVLNGRYRGADLESAFEATLLRDEIDVSDAQIRWADLQADGRGTLALSDISQSQVALELQGSAPMVSQLSGEIGYADQTLALQLNAGATELGPARLRSTGIQLAGEWPNFTGGLSYQGDMPLWGSRVPLSGAHSLAIDIAERRVSVEGTAKFDDEEIVIIDPIQAALEPALTVTGKVDALGGQVEFDVDPSDQRRARLAVTDVSMRQLGPFIQRRGLRGVMNGTALVEIKRGRLNGQADLDVRGLARGPSEEADVDLSAEMTDGLLNLSILAANEEEGLSLTGTAATRIAHRGDLLSLRPVADAPVPITLSGSGPLAPLWALAAPPDLRLEGDFAVDLSNGDGRTLRFNGPATLANGVFEDGFTGLHLVEISADANLNGDYIELVQARAQGGRSGTIAATGVYSFTGDGDVALTLDRLRAFKRSDVTAEVSGEAIVDRRDRRTHVAGDLEINRARINLSNLPGAGYTTLDVDFETAQAQASEATPTREAISLDVNLRADDRITVQGLGIDSEWGVDAKITGAAGAPQITGQAILVRGDADLLSRNFRLTEGVLSFAGDPEQSAINMRADRTSDGVTTSILVTGPVLAPEIGLSSDPSLPDDEILSRVLFGRSPSNLSALQAAQLAAAAAQLAGGDAFSLTGELEAATGLDRLDFGVNDAGEATLSTGKYLSNDLYLEIESGGSGAPGVALEWTPLDNVELDAEIDPELGPKVAIQWRRDFDRLPGETQRQEPARPSGSE
jgi:translocation and assembly module TamB